MQAFTCKYMRKYLIAQFYIHIFYKKDWCVVDNGGPLDYKANCIGRRNIIKIYNFGIQFRNCIFGTYDYSSSN
jgi:hypothetical protein